MWMDSEEEITKNMDQTSVESSKKPKRRMKTPFQLEMLENTYAMDMHPSEAIRAELSKKLGLTDRQLQMWFCHRRLKDKKEAAGMKPGTAVSAGRRGLIESSREELMVSEPSSRDGSGPMSRSGSGSGSASSEYDNEEYTPIRYFDSRRTVVEHSVIVCVEAQLGEPLREDGPILGVEFDELPPGVFDTPAVLTEQKDRFRHSYDSKLYGQSDVKHIKSAATGPREAVESKVRSNTNRHVAPSYLCKSTMHGNGHVPSEYGVECQLPSVDVPSQPAKWVQFSSSSRNLNLITHCENNLHIEKKRKSDYAQIGREVQAHEKKIRREPEKQDLISRKREEQMRKETERQDRERQKEEQRMIREQQRQEEKFQREMERKEKFMQRELLKEEKRKQKEEYRKEKEASRQKAAVERATARRIAKESTELMEDERLELMELAASSKGLSSIVFLDYDTMQNLDSFREALSEFPPKFVQLRMPFSIQPWINSEENVADLLMVWKFCVMFADVLGLWPCTLDEFVQAFHDYDSRLLGEIHIALLKLIIKDIEYIVRMPSGGPGTNQYTAINREGGHPHIVEGAYMWGFNISNWQKHLNPLTWPEILRQFSLSAGFGPQLKKKGTDRVCANDNAESKGSEDIVSTLRNGSAAEKAAAIMQEKGFNVLSRSRHRLTPGTVKFAAYHVLAFEGSKGLNVIQIAEKIQKSGLRDLTTSKTPEASISVALSRDAILFERIAPCTYCVRPAFRKDPAEAESIIAAAKEKIQRYSNGLLAGQKEGEEERDDDSDTDVGEGAEVDALAIPSDANQISKCNKVGSFPGNNKDDIPNATGLQNGIDIVEGNPDQDAEIDERSGEPWVQGLTEGEYSDLSVEERLKALVALIGVANEGNSIRVILEDRQDAANALKKQMLTEAQLDKRQMREEINAKLYNSYSNATAEGGLSPLVVAENKFFDPSTTTLGKNEPSVAAEHVGSVDNPAEYTSMDQFISRAQQNGYSAERSHLQLKSYIGHRAEEIYAYRSLPLGQDRRRNSYWMFAASASSHDPGLGRIFVESPNGCWKLIDSVEAFDTLLTSLDNRGTRESHLHIMLKKIEHCFKDCAQRIQLFPNVLDQNQNEGRKEMLDINSSHSCASAERSSMADCSSNPDAWEPSLSFGIELGQNEEEKKNFWKRYEDLQMWIWKECFNSTVLCGLGYGKKRCLPLLGICDLCLCTYDAKMELCPSCHRIHGKLGDEGYFLKQLNRKRKFIDGTALILSNSSPLRIRLLKALLTLLEVFVPEEALHSSWMEDHRNAWGVKLQNSSSSGDLLQILSQFEGAVKRDYISADFETTNELLSYCVSSRGAAYGFIYPESTAQLPWIPKTAAAVALRLLELDASISYTLNQKDESPDGKKVGALPNFTSRHAYANDIQKAEGKESNRNQSTKEKSLNHLHDTRGISGYRKAVHGRQGGRPGGKSQKRDVGSITKPGRQSMTQPKSLKQIPLQQGLRTQGQKHGKGRRTLRKRKTQQKAVVEETLRDYLHNKSNFKNVMKKPSSTGRQELRDTEVGNDNDVRDAVPNRSNKMMEMSEDDDDDNQIVGENAYDEEDGEDLEKDMEINDDDPGSEASVSGNYSD